MGTNQMGSDPGFSGVAQTANLGGSTSTSSGAAKIFREFKWGLLTLFILMAVVVCLVYDGGRNKKKEAAAPSGGVDKALADIGETPSSDLPGTPVTNVSGTGAGAGGTATLGNGGNVAGGGAGQSNVDFIDDPWNPRPRTGTSTTNNGNTPGQGGTMAGPLVRGDRTNRPIPDLANDPSRSIDRGTNRSGPPRAGDNRDTAGGRDRSDHGARDASRNEHTGVNAGFKIYVVKSGDCLTSIASENLPGKGGLKAITDANKDVLPDVNKLREGMKLKIPSAIPNAPVAENNSRNNTGGPRVETLRHENGHALVNNDRGERDHHTPELITQSDYVVQSGDSLEKIARKVLNDSRKWKTLLEWNKDRVSDETKLKVGTVLRTHAPGTNASPAGADPYRNRSNGAIRAESVYPMHETETNGEVIPISPVMMNSKAPASQNTEKNSATPKPAEHVETKGEPLPLD